MFTAIHPFSGVAHITDAMGVSFTLIEGTERAVLFDTGYGTEDVSAFVNKLTKKPVTVLLSHGHHDHVLGARWFMKSFLCAEDMEEFLEKTGEGQRKKVLKQAQDRGVPVPEDYMDTKIPLPDKIVFDESTGGFDCAHMDLGENPIQIVRVPGHTPGSIMLFVPKYGLLLTGDDWNPCTWMWFPSSLPATLWRDNMKTAVRTLECINHTEIQYVICSHRPEIRTGKEIKEFLNYMTDQRMKDAPETDMGAPINTHSICSDNNEWILIFDQSKINAL